MIEEILRVADDSPPVVNGKGEIITFMNPYSYVVARKSKIKLHKFDRIYLDGQLLVLLVRAFGFPRVRRSFDMTSLAANVLQQAEDGGNRVALVGGKPGVAALAGQRLKSRFPKLDICWTSHGYAKGADYIELISDVIKSAPEVLVVGMGTPQQEQFLLDCREAGFTGWGFTCGGFLHQTSSHGTGYYPTWANKLHLRWLYRIYDEPKLAQRYLADYPRALMIFVLDAFRFKRL